MLALPLSVINPLVMGAYLGLQSRSKMGKSMKAPLAKR